MFKNKVLCFESSILNKIKTKTCLDKKTCLHIIKEKSHQCQTLNFSNVKTSLVMFQLLSFL